MEVFVQLLSALDIVGRFNLSYINMLDTSSEFEEGPKGKKQAKVLSFCSGHSGSSLAALQSPLVLHWAWSECITIAHSTAVGLSALRLLITMASWPWTAHAFFLCSIMSGPSMKPGTTHLFPPVLRSKRCLLGLRLQLSDSYDLSFFKLLIIPLLRVYKRWTLCLGVLTLSRWRSLLTP